MSGGRPSVRRAGRVVRTEARRRWRSLRDAGWRLALLLSSGVFFLFPVAAVAFAAYLLGSGTFGSTPSPVRVAGAAVALVGTLEVTFVGIRTVRGNGDPDGAAAVLLAAPTPDVVLGLAAVEVLTMAGPVAAVAVAVSTAFAVGAGTPLAVPFVTLALAAAGVAGGVVGFAVGLAIRLAIARSETLARYKTAVGFALMLAYVAVITGGVDLPWSDAFLALAGRPPVAWFGALAMLGSAPDADLTAAAGGAVVIVAVAAAGYLASVAVADRLWFEPKASPGAAADADGRSTMVGGLVGRLDGAGTGGRGPFSRPAVRVARRSWLRAKRAPITLGYVIYPLFAAAGPLSTAVRTGVVPGWLPAALPLYGAWATGAAFALNPLGDEGAVLPITLTSGVSGRSFVLGRCLAGAVVGVPVTAVLTAAAAVAASLAPAATAAAVATALLLPALATGIGAGVGVALPRFDAVRVSRSREAVVPSLFAFALFSLVLVLASLPAVLGVTPTVGRGLESLVGVDSAALALAGVVTTLLLAGGAGGIGFVYGARRFDGYRLEDG